MPNFLFDLKSVKIQSYFTVLKLRYKHENFYVSHNITKITLVVKFSLIKKIFDFNNYRECNICNLKNISNIDKI